MAVISGFPHSSLATEFAQAFHTDLDGLPPVSVLKKPNRVDQLTYRLNQLSIISRTFLDKFQSMDADEVQKWLEPAEVKRLASMKTIFPVLPLNEEEEHISVETMVEQLQQLKLTIFWDKEETMDMIDEKFPLPFELTHVPGIDVRSIDDANFDPLDRDDDRNYFKSLREEQKLKRQSYLENLSKELDIPVVMLFVMEFHENEKSNPIQVHSHTRILTCMSNLIRKYVTYVTVTLSYFTHALMFNLFISMHN
jgi:hypothetical protein